MHVPHSLSEDKTASRCGTASPLTSNMSDGGTIPGSQREKCKPPSGPVKEAHNIRPRFAVNRNRRTPSTTIISTTGTTSPGGSQPNGSDESYTCVDSNRKQLRSAYSYSQLQHVPYMLLSQRSLEAREMEPPLMYISCQEELIQPKNA